MFTHDTLKGRTALITGGGSGIGWQFWIDRGGTFTDIVARRACGYEAHG